MCFWPVVNLGNEFFNSQVCDSALSMARLFVTLPQLSMVSRGCTPRIEVSLEGLVNLQRGTRVAVIGQIPNWKTLLLLADVPFQHKEQGDEAIQEHLGGC